jgi:hypothetical protein
MTAMPANAKATPTHAQLAGRTPSTSQSQTIASEM